MSQRVDAEVERPGREHDRHERADRGDEEEGTDHTGRGVLDAVHPVHRREQHLPDAEIDWRGHVTEGIRKRTARGVALVFARGNEKGRDPYEDEDGRQNGRGHNG